MPETGFRKSDGGFSAWLVLVPDDRELYQSWGAPSETVNVREVDTVLVNSPISAFVVFGGCAANVQGNCQVAMRYRILAPDGSVYTETPAMEVWSNKPAPANRVLQLSVGYLKVAIEPDEQVGSYGVQVQVLDEVADKVLTLERNFEAVPMGTEL